MLEFKKKDWMLHNKTCESVIKHTPMAMRWDVIGELCRQCGIQKSPQQYSDKWESIHVE